MKLSPKQAAEKLKVSPSTMLNLVKKYPDKFVVYPVGNGKLKKHFLIDSKSIIEFGKVYRNRKSVIQSKKIKKYSINPINPVGLISRIESKLSNLESKIDIFIDMWK